MTVAAAYGISPGPEVSAAWIDPSAEDLGFADWYTLFETPMLEKPNCFFELCERERA